MAVYDADYNNAQVIASQNMQKPQVQKEIKAILDGAGLSPEHVSEKLKKVFDAGSDNIQKATPADTIAIGNMFFKLINAYPGTKHMILSYSKQENLTQKTLVDLEAKLASLNTTSNALLAELKR